MPFFIKFPVAKNSMHEKRGIKIFRRIFLSQYAESFRKGTLWCCISENSASDKD